MKGQIRGAAIVLVTAGLFLVGISHGHAVSQKHGADAWGRFGEVTVLDSNKNLLTHQTVDEKRRSFMGAHGRQLCIEKTAEIFEGYDLTNCWYNSSIGEFSSYGNVWLPAGSSPPGFIGETAGDRIIPTLNPQVFLEFKPLESGGFQLNFRRVTESQLSVLAQYPDGPTFYEWGGQPAAALVRQSGDYVTVSDNMTATSLWYGRSGRYLLIVNEADGVLSRIDLLTFKMLTAAYVSNDATNRFGTFDITNDGSKVIANILGESPKIIHLDMCLGGGEEAYVSEPLVCPTLSLGGALNEFDDATGGRAELAHFKEDHIIELYTQTSNRYAENYYGKFYLYAPGTWQPDNRYIALGDSFASGEGAGDYYVGTNLRGKDGNLCHLSRRSYPFLLKQRVNTIESARSVACSGAKVRNIDSLFESISDDPAEDDWATNQYYIDVVDSELGEWTPGRYRQIEYFQKQYAPGLVTVGVSGNDMGFGHILEQCVDPRKRTTCFSDERERSMLIGQIDRQEERLIDLYEQLRKRAALGAHIYVIGYPEVIKPGGKCGVNVLLNSDEIKFVEGITKYINGVIKTAASKAGVSYIDLSEALHGYRLCENRYPAMNGATLNTWSERKFISPESYHPTSFGQRLFTDTILDKTDRFRLGNPRPSNTAYRLSVQEMVEIGLFSSERAATYAGMLSYYQPLQGSVVAKGDTRDISLVGKLYDLLPNSLFEVWLNSEPVHLGTFAADAEGNVDFSITIPKDIETDVHTLRILGRGNDGSDREVRAAIYTAHSYEDWDGDGIANNDQDCPYAVLDPANGGMTRGWCGRHQDNGILRLTLTQELNGDQGLASTGQSHSLTLLLSVIAVAAGLTSSFINIIKHAIIAKRGNIT